MLGINQGGSGSFKRKKEKKIIEIERKILGREGRSVVLHIVVCRQLILISL